MIVRSASVVTKSNKNVYLHVFKLTLENEIYKVF